MREWLPKMVVAFWQLVVLKGERNLLFLTKNCTKLNFDIKKYKESKSNGGLLFLCVLAHTSNYTLAQIKLHFLQFFSSFYIELRLLLHILNSKFFIKSSSQSTRWLWHQQEREGGFQGSSHIRLSRTAVSLRKHKNRSCYSRARSLQVRRCCFAQ